MKITFPPNPYYVITLLHSVFYLLICTQDLNLSDSRIIGDKFSEDVVEDYQYSTLSQNPCLSRHEI